MSRIAGFFRVRFVKLVATVGAVAITAVLQLFAASAVSVADDRKPNIVFIIADDLGYGDISSYGGPVSTPNIDALAAAGLRFTDFHSNGPVCTPTRVALMTGRYQQRAQLGNALAASPGVGLDPNQLTLSDVLKPAGYRTATVGKWHLGTLAKFQPGRQSFDFFYGFLNGEIDYVNHLDFLRQPRLVAKYDAGYHPDLLDDRDYPRGGRLHPAPEAESVFAFRLLSSAARALSGFG